VGSCSLVLNQARHRARILPLATLFEGTCIKLSRRRLGIAKGAILKELGAGFISADPVPIFNQVHQVRPKGCQAPWVLGWEDPGAEDSSSNAQQESFPIWPRTFIRAFTSDIFASVVLYHNCDPIK
jgi:hypothetical protein